MSTPKIINFSNTTNCWQFWCRLCSENNKSVNSPQKNLNYSHDEIITNAIRRYFRIKLTNHDQKNLYLCDACHALLKSLTKFTVVVNEAQRMFQYLQKSAENENLSNIRSQFGLLEDDGHSFKKLFEEEMNAYGCNTEITVKNEIVELSEDSTNANSITIEKYDTFPEISTTDAISCNKCQKTFVNNREYLKHTKNEHLDTNIEKKKLFQCDYCFKNFQKKATKDLHIKNIHIKQAENNEGSKTESQSQSQSDKPFKCEICEKRFKYEFRLKNHLPTHDPNRYVCDQCGKEYSSRKNLNNHILMHYEKTLQNKCDYCGKTFKRSTALRVHLILHTGGAVAQKPSNASRKRPRRQKIL